MKAKYKNVKHGGLHEHVAIVEAILGRKMQRSQQIHHIDGNGRNNTHNNLVVCPDAAYHRLLHLRAAALEACGNADFRRCSHCQTYDDLKNMVVRSRRGNWAYEHRHCRNAAYNRRYAKRKLKA